MAVNLSLIDLTNGECLLMKTIKNSKFQISIIDFDYRKKQPGNVHKVLAMNKNSKAMACDPRYDMRANLRQKLSQRDYLDKEMKQYHYVANNCIVNGV
jgi:hypothetical protein